MRDIVLDYIQPRGLRLAVLSLIAVVLLGVLVRVLLSLATVGLAA
jgi:succinate dehydrogenase / fumarate reductase membrane anchor subunit